MCLAIPGKVIEIRDKNGFKMAQIDFGGITREVCISWVDADVGSYILAHAGIALTVIDENEALTTLEVFNKLADAHR